MQKILDEIRNGDFAEEWIAENKAGRPKFEALRKEGQAHPIEAIGQELRAMMPFISAGKTRVQDASGGCRPAGGADGARWRFFVSPSNPTGAAHLRHEIEAIGRWAAGRGLWVLTDEIYEHLVYGDAEQHSMPVVVPERRTGACGERWPRPTP